MSTTRDWYAWIDIMPPPPNHFHVRGEVQVPNPGEEAQLTLKRAPGSEPRDLPARPALVQRPWIAIPKCKFSKHGPHSNSAGAHRAISASGRAAPSSKNTANHSDRGVDHADLPR